MPREKLVAEEIKEELRQLETETFEVEDLIDAENNVGSCCSSNASCSSTSTNSSSSSTSCSSTTSTTSSCTSSCTAIGD